MQPRVPCEFFVVRYVPDLVKGEFVNIGVLLREISQSTNGPMPMRVRFTRDWSRVRCVDASADLDLFEDLEQHLARHLAEGYTDLEPTALLSVLESSLSNSIQMTEPRAALAENLTTELEQLMRLYVEPMQQPGPAKGTRKTTGRPAILSAMRTHFERASVWQLLSKRIPTERYTRKGDPLKLDCGYRKDTKTGNALRIFHAVSLDGDLESAKVLAFTSPQLRDGVARIDDTTLELTAVVEPLQSIAPEEGELQERYRFGIETMEQQQIRVITINDLARAAATTRQELGL
jgi:hypothetical protein